MLHRQSTMFSHQFGQQHVSIADLVAQSVDGVKQISVVRLDFRTGLCLVEELQDCEIR
jgi:hypothetical protein